MQRDCDLRSIRNAKNLFYPIGGRKVAIGREDGEAAAVDDVNQLFELA